MILSESEQECLGIPAFFMEEKMEPNSALLHRALKYYYGYDEFREGQEKIITTILEGKSVLAILPTGAGKSLCFQLPSLLLQGVTLVVSPLISLMKDQAENLNKRGISAAYLDSSMTGNRYGRVLHEVLSCHCKFLYVAPERLANPQFLCFAQRAQITMVAIDEAHCVSQWGRSFRREYYHIPAFIAKLPRKPLLVAFTASATPEVRKDILEHLGIADAQIFVTGFDRPNLYFAVLRLHDKRRALLEYLERHRQESGVIYCATRAKVEEVTQLLASSGYAAIRYHAGLTPEERRRNQNLFVHGKVGLVVATNAFGMGIDKADVRFVVHYNMPKDLEGYYQEAGRAGRDGKPAECILFYDDSDTEINEHLIKQAQKEIAVRELEQRLLERMIAYCHTRGCLRQFMLAYFGEHAPSCCHNCSNCLKST